MLFLAYNIHMKKAVIVLLALATLGILGFLATRATESTSEIIYRVKNDANSPSKFTPLEEKPEPGKYRFLKDYVVLVCVKTAPGWEGVPFCVNDEYYEKTLFIKGDVVNSTNASFNDQGSGWGINFGGLLYGGYPLGASMDYVEKVPDSTSEKHSPF